MSDFGERVPRWAWQLLAVLAAGGLLGRLGPFETFGDLTSAERYAYWVGLTLLMWLQGVTILTVLAPILSRRGWPRWQQVIAAALLAAIPTGFEVAWAEMFLRVERDLGPADLLAIVGDVALLSVPLLLATHGRLPIGAEEPGELSRGGGAEALLALMKPDRRGRLVAVGSEDHYVRLYTDRGDQLVAMRLADAIEGLGMDEGQQVHRRWWVAAHAVGTVERSGDGLQLNLSNGLTVPVSRSYAQQVRRAWADRLA